MVGFIQPYLNGEDGVCFHTSIESIDSLDSWEIVLSILCLQRLAMFETCCFCRCECFALICDSMWMRFDLQISESL